MKGYVKVTNQQLNEAIIGFEKQYEKGKKLLDKGIELYYIKNYVGGSWLTRFMNRKKTPKQFASKACGVFGSWDDVLYVVLNKEETEVLSWWCWTTANEINPLKALVSQSSDGVALVDQEMAAIIKKYRSYN